MNIHHVKLKSRREMERTIPREKLGWWHDVCPGERLVLRDARDSDLARCILREGSSRNPSDYLCELPESGSLVFKAAIAHMTTIEMPVVKATGEKA